MHCDVCNTLGCMSKRGTVMHQGLGGAHDVHTLLSSEEFVVVEGTRVPGQDLYPI